MSIKKHLICSIFDTSFDLNHFKYPKLKSYYNAFSKIYRKHFIIALKRLCSSEYIPGYIPRYIEPKIMMNNKKWKINYGPYSSRNENHGTLWNMVRNETNGPKGYSKSTLIRNTISNVAAPFVKSLLSYIRCHLSAFRFLGVSAPRPSSKHC